MYAMTRILIFFKWSLFGQISKNFFWERLAVSIGARNDGNSYASGMNNPFKQVSPRLSLSYPLTPEWFINVDAERYYQPPSYTTMGYADTQGELVNKQNELKHIGTNHYVMGLEYHPSSRTKITLEGFYKTYDHYPISLLDSIVLTNKGTDYVAIGDKPVKSLGEGHAYRGELMVRTQEFFGIVASFTPYDPETNSLIAARSTKRQPYLDYSRFNSERAFLFHQQDIQVDRSFFIKKWSLILYADIQNIYNHKTKSPDLLVLQENSDGSYKIDPDHPDRYLMRHIKNDTGTLLPSMGIIIDF